VPNASAKRIASRISSSIPLAHSTADANFVKICSGNKRLLSPAALDAAGIRSLDPACVEKTLQTAKFAFLYAAPFAFPSSGCGLLFAKELEAQHSEDGFATSFDSGGLVHKYQRVDMAEPPHTFFRRHEIPIPDHRKYLERSLTLLFSVPADYLDGKAPVHPGPVGLAGGDRRRWCHEVRIPGEVAIRSTHLRAIFIPRRVGLVRSVKSLAKWCRQEGFDVVQYAADRNNDFAKLRKACISYLRQRIC
jgi:hypothetical protein